MGGVRCPVLIGREAEYQELVAAVRGLGAGAGGLWMVIGEAGVGKSRLVREVVSGAASTGLTTFTGRAVEGGQAPYRGLTEVVLAANRAGTRRSAPELAMFRRALDLLVAAPDAQVGTEPAGSASLLVAEGVLRLLGTVATSRRPVLVVLEDLQWADAETVRVVEYLADHLVGERVGVLATVRTGEPSEALVVARSLAARRTAWLTELGRLTDPDVRLMTAACLGKAEPPDYLAAFVLANADGLPFFVEELLADASDRTGPLISRAPEQFADTVRRRLSGLGVAGVEVLRAAALLGSRFDWALLAPMAGLPAHTVDDVLRRAVELQLVEPADGGPSLRFRHALTRSAVLADTPPGERTALAASGLAAVEQAHPGLPGRWCEEAARLADDAGDPQRAARLLLDAGRRALRVGALNSAVERLEQARHRAGADHRLAAEIQDVLLDALALRGELDRVQTTGAALLRTLDRIDAKPDRYAEAHLRLARAAIAAERWSSASQQIEAAEARLDGARPAHLDCQLKALAAHVALGQGLLDAARSLAEEALAGARVAELPEIACEALEAIGRADRPDDLDSAAAAFREALRTAERAGLGLWRARALQEIGSIDLLRRYRPDLLEQALVAAQEAGASALAVEIDMQLAALYALRFEPDRALPVAERCVTAARRLGLGSLPMALIRVGLANAIKGDRIPMQRTLDEALGCGDQPAVRVLALACQAHYWLLNEQRDRAMAALDQAVDVMGSGGAVPPGPFRPLWALLRGVSGADGEAAVRAVSTPDVLGTAVGRALLGYTRAVLAGRNGDAVAATAHVAAADHEFGAMDGEQGYQHVGRRLVAEAALADGWGQPADWLAAAETYCSTHGIDRVAAACRALLRSAGVRVLRRGRGESAVPEALPAQGITSREVDVLALVAVGLTNREIGDRLFVSHRTVDSHVQSLLSKTGSHSRTQLAALAAATGLG